MTTQRRIIAYNPPPDRPRPRVQASTRAPVAAPACGVDCHVQQRKEARNLLAGLAIGGALLAVVLFCWPHHNSGGPLYPGGPVWTPPGQSSAHGGATAAVIAGEARGARDVVHGVGHAARLGFRIARISRYGSFHVPGTGGFHVFHFGL